MKQGVSGEMWTSSRLSSCGSVMVVEILITPCYKTPMVRYGVSHGSTVLLAVAACGKSCMRRAIVVVFKAQLPEFIMVEEFIAEKIFIKMIFFYIVFTNNCINR